MQLTTVQSYAGNKYKDKMVWFSIKFC